MELWLEYDVIGQFSGPFRGTIVAMELMFALCSRLWYLRHTVAFLPQRGHPHPQNSGSRRPSYPCANSVRNRHSHTFTWDLLTKIAKEGWS